MNFEVMNILVENFYVPQFSWKQGQNNNYY